MNLANLNRKLIRTCCLIALFSTLIITQVAAAANIGTTGLELLGITQETYREAKTTAKQAYNAEMVELGWATAEKAERADARNRWVRVGSGQYYAGILDKDAFIADALGISVDALAAAEDANYEAKLATKVERGRITEEESADLGSLINFPTPTEDSLGGHNHQIRMMWEVLRNQNSK